MTRSSFAVSDASELPNRLESPRAAAHRAALQNLSGSLPRCRYGESSLSGSTQNSSLGFNSTSGIGSNFDSSKGGSWGSGAPSSLKRFPYHLLYRILSDRIRVTAVRHHKQNPRSGLQPR